MANSDIKTSLACFWNGLSYDNSSQILSYHFHLVFLTSICHIFANILHWNATR